MRLAFVPFMDVRTLLLFVRGSEGFEALKIDATGLSGLGEVSPKRVLRVVGSQRPDAVAVASPLDAEAHELLQSLAEWTEAGRFPLFSLSTPVAAGIDPFKAYEAVWGLLDAVRA